MKVRVCLNECSLEALDKPFLFSVDWLERNQYGHEDGQILVVNLDGSIEFGYLGGDTDVGTFENYKPVLAWANFDVFTGDEEVNDIKKELWHGFVEQFELMRILTKDACNGLAD